MTKQEFESLYGNNVAIHCDTEEKANEFLALADSFGYKWVNKRELINYSQWEIYKEKTCYEVTKQGLMFSDKNYFKVNGYQFIEYQLQPKFKLGDKVRVNNTSTAVNGKIGVVESVSSSSPMLYTVEITDDYSSGFWYLYETQLEKVKEPIDKEETIDDIIKEIKDNQKRTTILLNRLGTMVKNK